MRKKPRKPGRILANPMGYVMEKLTPLGQLDDELVKLKIRNHDALNALRQGRGTQLDTDMVIGAVNMSEGLQLLYQRGADYKSEIRAAQDAVFTMAVRGVTTGRYLFTGPELTAVNLGMEIHDAQLDITTFGELMETVDFVKKLQRSKEVRLIKNQQGEPA